MYFSFELHDFFCTNCQTDVAFIISLIWVHYFYLNPYCCIEVTLLKYTCWLLKPTSGKNKNSSAASATCAVEDNNHEEETPSLPPDHDYAGSPTPLLDQPLKHDKATQCSGPPELNKQLLRTDHLSLEFGNLFFFSWSADKGLHKCLSDGCSWSGVYVTDEAAAEFAAGSPCWNISCLSHKSARLHHCGTTSWRRRWGLTFHGCPGRPFKLQCHNVLKITIQQQPVSLTALKPRSRNPTTLTQEASLTVIITAKIQSNTWWQLLPVV